MKSSYGIGAVVSREFEPREVVVGPAEEISTSELRADIAKMKSGKAAGSSEIAAEMLKAAGEDGVLWVTDNAMLL